VSDLPRLPPSPITSALRRLHTHALRERFPCYLQQAFHALNPTQPYIANWHLNAIAEYLHALETCAITRLIINMPPRSLKSLSVTVAWTSYLLGRNPAQKIITASYSSALSLKHAMDARALMQSAWYHRAFPDMRILAGQNEKHKCVTTQHGFRLATSVGGTLTGEGGDFIIMDDPLNPAQAASERFRSRANHWFDHTLSSRLNDKLTGRMLLVMQRLHTDDMTGHLLSKGGWEHVCLPAQAQSPLTISIGKFHKVMEVGELLQPARESLAVLEQLRRDLGSHGFAAQYLQSPVSLEGNMIRRAWLHSAEHFPASYDFLVQSWDTAIKTGKNNDYSACVTIGVMQGKYYIIDVLAFRAEYAELKRSIISQYDTHRPHAVVIEDKASGQSLLQDLRREGELPVVAYQPKGDKLHRAARVTPLMESGQVLLPARAAWKNALEAELLSFPHAQHDDQVDAFVQGIAWLKDREHRQSFIRTI
jgi:predicted phage terminase large subunit-like protein